MPSFFTTLPNDLKLKIFAAVSKHEQAQLTQVNQEFHNLQPLNTQNRLH